MADICEDMIAGEEQILATVLLENSATLSWSIKDDFAAPPENRHEIMALQAVILMNLVRGSEDYLGKVDFVLVRHQGGADAILFPVRDRPKRIFCVLARRPYDFDWIIKKAAGLLSS